MTHNTKEVEEVIKEFDSKFFIGVKNVYGEEKTLLFPAKAEVRDWLRTTLHHQLQKAREEEREKIANDLISYQHESGNSHIDIEWFVETLFTQNNSELDQPNN